MYAGLHTATTPGFSFHPTYLAYDTTTDSFVERTLDALFRSTMETYLHQAYPHHNVTVTLLCEVPFGFGLGANAALATALALLLDPAESEKSAHAIAAAAQHGVSSGSSVITTLHPNRFPILHNHSITKPLTELLKGHAPLFCYDVALVYTGIPNYGESAIRASQATLEDLEKQSEEIRQILGDTQQSLTERYVEALNGTTEIIVLSLQQLLLQGSKTLSYLRLAQGVNQFHTLLETVHPFDDSATALRQALLNNTPGNSPLLGVKISGYGSGGVLLVVAPEGQYRSYIEETVSVLSQKTGRSYALEYASWRDGFNAQGAQTIQNTQIAKASSHLRGHLLKLKLIHGATESEEIIPSDGLATFLERNHFDVVADLTTHKITIGGKPVTSKDLPSQKSTAQLLDILLKNQSHSIHSEDVAGSYGLSRYDLQGKIIIPLKKVIKDRLNHDLILKLQGTTQEFTVAINPGKLSILIVSSNL
jgi:mevalonate kinase